MEKQSNHPLARAIVNKFPNVEPIELEVENKIGIGLVTTYLGAEYCIAKVTAFTNASDALTKQVECLAKEGKTVVYVARNSKVVGLLAFMDIPKDVYKRQFPYFSINILITILA